MSDPLGSYLIKTGHPSHIIKADLIELAPCGTEMQVTLFDVDGATIRLISNHIKMLTDAETGEIFSDPRDHLRQLWIQWCHKTYGNLRLQECIDFLPITDIGPGISRALASHFHTWDNLIITCSAIAKSTAHELGISGKYIGALNEDEEKDPWLQLTEIEGVGPATAKKLLQWFENPEAAVFIKKYFSDIRIAPFQDTKAFKSKFSGQTIVFTGTLKSVSRGEAKARAESVGFIVAGSVRKNTKLLVVGESPGEKLEKAKELDVETISEEDFLNLLDTV